MPNYGTLDDVQNIKEIKIETSGWKNVVIQFGHTERNGIVYLHWRIKNTAHIFTVQSQQINKMGSTLEEHFKIALATFRTDYIAWWKDGFKHKWQREYEFMFKKFITI